MYLSVNCRARSALVPFAAAAMEPAGLPPMSAAAAASVAVEFKGDAAANNAVEKLFAVNGNAKTTTATAMQAHAK